MKKIIAAALIVLGSTAAGAANPCNPAIQNWENGSRTTCPIADGSSGVAPAARPHSPEHTTWYPKDERTASRQKR